MRIASLRLCNFRSYTETTLDLQPLTICRGKNYSGKSTIVQAIELALAGRSDATDERGAGAGNLIRTGKDQGSVTIEMVGNDGTTRFLDCSLSLDAGRELKITNPDDPTSPGEDFKYFLKGQSETLSCLIDTRRFISKPAAEQKNILASIVLPFEYEWPADRIAQAREVGMQVDWKMQPMEVITKAYDVAYKARTAINRQVKEFTLPSGDTSKAGDETEVRVKLATRKEELAEVEKKSNAEETAIRVHAANAENATTKLQSAENRLRQVQQEAENTKKEVLSKQVAKTLEVLTKKAPDGEKLVALIAEKNAELAVKRRELTNLEALGEKVGSVCPTCLQGITIEMLKGMVEPVMAAIDTLAKDVRAAQDLLKAIGDYAGAQKKLDANLSASEEAARLERRIAQAHEDVVAARTAHEALHEPPTKTEGLEVQISQLRTNIQTGEGVLQERIRANALKAAVAEAQNKKAKLDKHQAILEDLVEYFGTGPKSAMTALLSAHIEPFEASMNERLTPWGYQCRLNFEPFVFGVTRGEKTYALHLLSESERYQFAIAFQSALAHQSGHNFVVVDATEIFDTAGRRAMMNSLLSAGLDQVIVLATDERTDPIPAGAGPSALYMLRCETENDIPTTYVEPLGA